MTPQCRFSGIKAPLSFPGKKNSVLLNKEMQLKYDRASGQKTPIPNNY